MSSLESNKTLAGVGSILLIFPFISIVGIILILIGMKGLSDYYKEPSIYQNTIWGAVFGFIAAIAIAVAVPLFFISGAFGVFALGLGLLALFGLAVVVFVFYLMAAMYFRRAFSTLAQKSGEHLFETAGLLLWIGAILTIVFFIGLLIILVAWIIATIAFFSIKVPATQPYTYTPPSSPSSPTAPSAQAARYCSNCGAPVSLDATFCAHCGKQLPPA
jgi:uncharacterized membrane protein